MLDASVLVAAFAVEEKTPAVRRVLGDLGESGDELHAPDLIAYELANALRKRVAREEISAEVAAALMEDFSGLELELHGPRPLARVALGLAVSHRLTAYDAAYLALALALAAPLLTLDTDLRDAALAAGITAPAV